MPACNDLMPLGDDSTKCRGQILTAGIGGDVELSSPDRLGSGLRSEQRDRAAANAVRRGMIRA